MPTTLGVTVSENVELPKGSTMLKHPNGGFRGIQLPSGECVQPWIVWEMFARFGKECEECDLPTHELEDLGMAVDLEFTRACAIVDGPALPDMSISL